jgi:hypothetical protein
MAEQQAEPSQAANCDQIPIIDLSTIDSPNIEERRELARAIYDACTQVGFFYIKVLEYSKLLGVVISSCILTFVFGTPEPWDSRGHDQRHPSSSGAIF